MNENLETLAAGGRAGSLVPLNNILGMQALTAVLTREAPSYTFDLSVPEGTSNISACLRFWQLSFDNGDHKYKLGWAGVPEPKIVNGRAKVEVKALLHDQNFDDPWTATIYADVYFYR